MDRVNAWLFGRWRPAGLVVNVPEGMLPTFEEPGEDGIPVRWQWREWREIVREDRGIDRIENGGEVPAGVLPAGVAPVAVDVHPVAMRRVAQVPVFTQEDMTREARIGYPQGFNAGFRSNVFVDFTLIIIASAVMVLHIAVLVVYYRQN